MLQRILEDNKIPPDILQAIDRELDNLPGFSDEAVSHALKRESAIIVESERIFRKEGDDFGESRLYKLLHSPLYRYICHPNRTQRILAVKIRGMKGTNVLENTSDQGKRRKLTRWFDVVIPNSRGRAADSIDYRRFILETRETTGKKIRVFQNRIREKIQAKDKACHVAEYFPLVLTNGCYYTRSLKRIVGVCGTTEPVVVGGDVEMSGPADFGNIKHIVIPPGCDNCLEKWFDVFRDPMSLKTVSGAENHPEVGLSGGVVYDRTTKRLVNILGDRDEIVVAKDVVIDDLRFLFDRLEENNVKRIHFCGQLPNVSVRIPSDTFTRRLAYWWDCKTWKTFLRMFKKRVRRGRFEYLRSKLEVTVSRQDADERTRQVVDSGSWEGLLANWGEP